MGDDPKGRHAQDATIEGLRLHLQPQRQRVLVVGLSPTIHGDKPCPAPMLANSLASRNTLEADLAAHQVTILMPNARDARRIGQTGEDHLRWALLARPVEDVGLTYEDPGATFPLPTQRLSTHSLPGFVDSWNRPAAGGPLCPDFQTIQVQSHQMREALTRRHGMAPQPVRVTGWPQMDCHRKPGRVWPRANLLSQVGLDPGRYPVFLGANNARLRPHEPSMAAQLVRLLAQAPQASDVNLVTRPHPNDGARQERSGLPHDPPRVPVLPAERRRLECLAGLPTHARVLLPLASTIGLDAMATDTCVLDLVFHYEFRPSLRQSARRWYELNCCAPLAHNGDIGLAEGSAQFDQAPYAYPAGPGLDAQGHARCRGRQLVRLGGQASRRLADLQQDQAQRARERGAA